MGRFDSSIVTAKRLIKRNGELVNWVKSQVVQDGVKPWKVANGAVIDPIPVVIVFFSPKVKTHKDIELLADTSVAQGSPVGLMAAVDFTPAINDKVERGTLTYVIKDIDILAPNGQVILYKLTFA